MTEPTDLLAWIGGAFPADSASLPRRKPTPPTPQAGALGIPNIPARKPTPSSPDAPFNLPYIGMQASNPAPIPPIPDRAPLPPETDLIPARNPLRTSQEPNFSGGFDSDVASSIWGIGYHTGNVPEFNERFVKEFNGRQERSVSKSVKKAVEMATEISTISPFISSTDMSEMLYATGYTESHYNKRKNPKSTASGFWQVLYPTARDLLTRYKYVLGTDAFDLEAKTGKSWHTLSNMSRSDFSKELKNNDNLGAVLAALKYVDTAGHKGMPELWEKLREK